MKRSTVSVLRSPAKDEAKQARPNTSTALVNTSLRPKRSASGPADNAPAAKPNSAALSTGPNIDLVTPQSLIKDGAM